jgi:hypothetical protein
MTFDQYIPLAIRTESPRSSCSEQNRLLHASMGAMTESVELLSFSDQLNLFEELGDICWYIAIAVDTIKPVEFEPVVTRVLDSLRQGVAIRNLCEQSSHLLDMTKKNVFYGKQIDKVAFAQTCQLIIELIKSICNMNGIQFSNVLAANIRKLQVRYPEKYSDHNADSRDLYLERKALV